MVDRSRESTRARLGFYGTVRGGIQENGGTGTRLAPNIFGGGGHTRRLAESCRRPEPTPRAYCGDRVTGQAPCYAVVRTVSPVRYSILVRSIPAPSIGRTRMGIQPGRRVPAQHSWSPVYLLGPGYPAPAQPSAFCASAHPARTGCVSSSTSCAYSPHSP